MNMDESLRLRKALAKTRPSGREKHHISQSSRRAENHHSQRNTLHRNATRGSVAAGVDQPLRKRVLQDLVGFAALALANGTSWLEAKSE